MTPETRQEQIKRETERLRAFQRKADVVSSLIMCTDLPWVDIAIQIETLRLDAILLFPLARPELAPWWWCRPGKEGHCRYHQNECKRQSPTFFATNSNRVAAALVKQDAGTHCHLVSEVTRLTTTIAQGRANES